MSRYIDADKLQELLQQEFEKEGVKADKMAMSGCADASVKYNHGQFCYLNAQELLKDTPTADVVEVVRCKDCKHSFRYECKNDACYKYTMCRRREHYSEEVDENDYCSYGERRENDNTRKSH